MTSYQDVHRKIWDLVESYWIPNAIFGHGPDHALRAYQIGLSIAARENADPLIVGAGCYFMDSGLDLKNGRRNHIERSIEIARDVINRIPELQSVARDILLAIRHHEGDDVLPIGLPFEATVVRDADTIDRLGITGIRMTLRYGLWIRRPLCRQTDPLCTARRPELNGYSLDYVRYLLQLHTALSTNTAKSFSARKKREQELFYERFEKLCVDRTPSYEETFLLLEELETLSDALAKDKPFNEPLLT